MRTPVVALLPLLLVLLSGLHLIRASDGDAGASEAAKSDTAVEASDPDVLLRTLLQSYDLDPEDLDAATTANDKAPAAGASPENAAAQTASGLRTGALQTGSLQTSSALQPADLEGYPALPDVRPTASILYPTPEDLARKRAADEAIWARKLFFIQNPPRETR